MKTIAALTLGLFAAVSTYGGSDIVEDTVTFVPMQAFLTGPDGMTLYTFTNDDAAASTCYDNCAVTWPPYLADASAQSPGHGFSIIDRKDGTRQWAKDGAPLYFWAGDAAPGDANGDGIGGVWHIAR